MTSTEVRASPKEVLFNTAARLFYERGYRATGVDAIAAESGIGKMTLYRHYPSKTALIVAYLRDSDEAFWRHFDDITRDAPSARAKLLALFEGLQTYTTAPDCYGCPFLNVACEYPEPEHPGHQIAVEHKRRVRERLRQLAADAGAREPGTLADALLLLMDGAYMAARVHGASPESPARDLAGAARLLIEAQIAE